MVGMEVYHELPVSVETLSGGRADERPLRFQVEGRTVEVAEVLGRWREPEVEGFRILGNDGLRYTLRHRPGENRWTLSGGEKPGETPRPGPTA
jgi:hypothetical protein